MKLYSWNVNGLRAVIRKKALQEFLEDQNPDILCLQEIKAKPEQVEFDFDGYEVFWNPAKRPGYSGTAILVKQDYLDTDFMQEYNEPSTVFTDSPNLDRDVLREGRILTLEFANFYLVDVYTPNSKPDLSRLELREKFWDPSFLKYLKELEAIKPVITCGDFNAAHTEIDLARPDANHFHAGFTDQERQGITNLLSADFIDTFRELHPETKRYSWWSFRGNARANNVGWRIDYFFISKNLLPILEHAEIHDQITGSDHCPISITLKPQRK